jgi:hypothetical protein
MNWLLINKYGYNSNLYSGYQGPGTAGNILALQLVMDGLKDQPANPSFLDARNAILSADLALTGGENQPEIWQAFARRGLGLSAKDSDANATTVTPAFDMPLFTSVKAVAPANAAEHVPLTNVTVATVSDPTNPLPASSYIATIDWGDGTSSVGTVIATGSAGNFIVQGSKTYDDGGTYALRVTLTKIGSITVASSVKVKVKDSPLFSTGTSITTTEGKTFSGLVATFTDSDIEKRDVTEYQATINWGDGTQVPGTIIALPSGGFEVDGTHAFGAGQSTVTVTIKNIPGTVTVATDPATVSDSAFNGTGTTFTSVEGQNFTGVVANFTDADPRTPPVSYYTAVIDWGDGTTSPGTIGAVAAGAYQVTGTHRFKGGTFTVKVSLKDGDVSSTTVTSTGTIAAAPVTGVAANLNAIDGSPFSGVVAAFTSANPFAQPAEFTVTIDWGDKSKTSLGNIDPQGFGQFIITGQHTYAAGSYTPTISLTETAANATTSVQGTASVVASPLDSNAKTLTATEGQNLTGAVATFTTVKPTAQPGDYTANISWGDGSTSAGTITGTAASGFSVAGVHMYALPRLYTYTVLIQTLSGSVTTLATGTVQVGAASLSPGALAVINATERTATGPVVAGKFTYGSIVATSDRFAATIAWGDGTTGPGVVQATATPGSFNVIGNHTYAAAGTFSVNVVVQPQTGASITTQGTAVVSNVIGPLRGSLEAASDTGVVGDWITAVNAPVFSGSAEANTTVTLYAVPAGQTSAIVLGQGTTNATGGWRIQSAPLGDGSYAIYARAVDSVGLPASALTPLSATGTSTALVIATTGPKVTALSLDPRTDTLHISLQGNIAALDMASLLNPADYQLSLPTARGSQIFAPASIGLDPSSPGTVLVRFNAGRMRGNYIVTLNSTGITDRAGNPLSEKYFLNFPATNQAPGQPFVAQISTNGRTASAPMPFVPPDQMRSAAQFERFLGRSRGFTRALRARRR